MSVDIINLECFTSFYLEKDQAAVCGIVLSDGEKKRPFFKLKPEGDYLNGLLELIIERIQYLKGKLADEAIHFDVHVHHKNKNFKTALDKVIKAANTARGYKGDVRDNIIKHTLIRKDYHKPACYEKMTELAKLLIETNDPYHRVSITTCGDSRSSDQLAAYTACQGAWNDLRAAISPDAAQCPVPVN